MALRPIVPSSTMFVDNFLQPRLVILLLQLLLYRFLILELVLACHYLEFTNACNVLGVQFALGRAREGRWEL